MRRRFGWHWWYTQAAASGFENCRKQLQLLNPNLNEVGLDYTYEVLPDEHGVPTIRKREDDDKPATGVADPLEDWSIHELEVAECRSLPRPDEEGYVPPEDMLSTTGNQAIPGCEEEEGSGDHEPQAPVVGSYK